MTAIHRFVEAARAGRLDRVIGRMGSGWAVMGDPQVLRGYCLLYPDPVVSDLNALEGEAREEFLRDMGRLGDAVRAVTGCVRVNYEILGNVEPALHAHVVPRYGEEVEGLRTKPVWFYDWGMAEGFDLERHGGLLSELRQALGGDLAEVLE